MTGLGTGFAKRGDTLDETLDVCRAVWGPNPVSYEESLVDKAERWMPIAMGGVEQLAEDVAAAVFSAARVAGV